MPSRDDNFFEVGGHSLLAMQVVVRIKEQVDLDVPLRLLAEPRDAVRDLVLDKPTTDYFRLLHCDSPC